MRIIVCIKQVPDTEARIKVKDGAPGIDRANVKSIISPYDEFALEEALLLKEKHGGTVVALSLGPDRVKEVLKTCLAVGVDSAVQISDAALAGADGLGVAQALAAAVTKLGADLVLVGKRAVGVDRGEVGAQIAQLLDYPFVSQVAHFESADGSTLRVEREFEGGVEVFEVDAPAVISAEKSAHELRRASLKGIMASKSKPITTLTLADLGLSAGDLVPRTRVQKMEYPPQRQAGRVIDGDAAGASRELVRLLREEAKII